MKKIKYVFLGDSITDAGRDYSNHHDMGHGYPKYASEIITSEHTDKEFEFFNFGISGNRTSQLFDRLYTDALVFEPDVISVLIGINDIWHRWMSDIKIATTYEQIELNYRCILERIRRESNAKIVMMSPFMLDTPLHPNLRKDLPQLISIVRNLADEFADVFIPLDKHFEEAMKTQPTALYYSDDGVHPNENGSAFIGKLYSKAVAPLINSL